MSDFTWPLTHINLAFKCNTFLLPFTELKTKLNARPAPPPKPKVIVQKPAQDVIAMEQLIGTLRGENNNLNRQVRKVTCGRLSLCM